MEPVDALVVVALVVDVTALWLDVWDIVAVAPPVELVPYTAIWHAEVIPIALVSPNAAAIGGSVRPDEEKRAPQ